MTTQQPTGTYRVYFALGEPGTYWGRLQSSKIVEAESRAAAVASVTYGTGAEVITWAPGEREALQASRAGQ